MKALTLWQPWASLVALGEKRIETRCWSTKYRGHLAIHAAAKTPAFLGASRHTEQFIAELADVLNVRISAVPCAVAELPRSAVLCIVELCSIEETTRCREILCERERIFGNYEDGRYAWALEMVEKLEPPIPAKGNRLLWNWNEVSVVSR
ncbi:MAG TPA: ASCH domain-containing protein [Bryobacteraceae bacterium]|nr:ASCH domain-containing protein [Bryobacteraceae bacterium]